jgi:DNA-directed RNA polymerase specialized sigma24 family protein
MDMVEPDLSASEVAAPRAVDADRLGDLYLRHRRAAFGLAYLVCADRDRADDAVQERSNG